MDSIPITSTLITTLESNRKYPKIYNLAPPIKKRVEAFEKIDWAKMITVEPILDFDTDQFVKMIKGCEVQQVNIGADSGHNHLPEPPKGKIIELISELRKFTTVFEKKNLKRILA
jgi:DNA repair photolyase